MPSGGPQIPKLGNMDFMCGTERPLSAGANGEMLFNGFRVSVLQDVKVREICSTAM